MAVSFYIYNIVNSTICIMIKTTVDRTGMVVFDALHPTIATFTDEGWLGSVGGSNRTNVTAYASNLSHAVQAIVKNDIKTTLVMSNLTEIMTHVTYDTTTLSSALTSTNDIVGRNDYTLQNTNALLNQVVAAVNSIITVVNNHTSVVSQVVQLLTRKSLYTGQSASDFQIAMITPAFHVDSILYSIQTFGGINAANQSGELPNYLLTADLKFQLDMLNYLLIPDYEKMTLSN